MVELVFKNSVDAALVQLGDDLVINGGRRTVREGKLIDRLIEVIKESLKDLKISELSPEAKQKIIEVWVAAYTNVIAPLDLPYVPNGVIEAAVDKFILDASVMFLKTILKVESV